jgi:short subunit dehydrogenase-like uncharacterized protein
MVVGDAPPGSVVRLMAGRIVVFGATGYSGRLVAERLVAAGLAPVLAGRKGARLSELAARLGGLEVARADALRANSVFSLVSSGDVLITTVGPYVKHGEPAVRAAIAVGCRYIDTCGEPVFLRRLFEEFTRPAADAGAVLLPALGYDYVPGALAGALALRDAPDAVRVDIGYYVLDRSVAVLSEGTRETLVGVSLADGYAFRDGALRTVRPAERVRAFTVAGRRREALSAGGAEHFTLPAVYPGLREVNVYLGWFGPFTRPIQAGSLLGEVVQRVPGARGAMRLVGEQMVGFAPGPEPGTTPGGRSWVIAEAFSVDGDRLASVTVAGVDGYEFTAGFITWAVTRPVEGVGCLGPVEAFGLDALVEGCRAAGLEQVR